MDDYVNQVLLTEKKISQLELDIKNIESGNGLGIVNKSPVSVGDLATENSKLKYQIQILEKSIDSLDKEGITKKKQKDVEKPVVCHQMKPSKEFIAHRESMWQKLKSEHEKWVSVQERKPIQITLPDGRVVDGKAWESTPIEITKTAISEGLANNAIIARVNGELWDLDRPLEHDAKLEILKFEDPDGQYVFWHSSAHILGEAMEGHYDGHLCYGPPVENGFYYDMWCPNKQVSANDLPLLKEKMEKIAKEKQNFERLEMTKENLLDMFSYNEFKKRIINEKVTTPTTTVYKCGPLIDLCRGPHVRHTGKVKALSVVKNSATYWEGKADAESLQRIYGISFPDKKQLKEWEAFQIEAAKRDHRKLGKEHDLFFFHELSPGSCFFLPKGAHIYNTLLTFIREQYWQRGFNEVVSPNIYNVKLWETSGHSAHYADNMFSFEVEKEKYALKPMNCPGHCIMFNYKNRSWRDLPLRFADFGVLHRNELSGTLSGLTRVRRFQQDDAHIFCRSDQIKEEMIGCLDFIHNVYGLFGFTYRMQLSTRPEKYLGELTTWDFAEQQLKESLDAFGSAWTVNPGDGAFYGPKIDITIKDALNREHQCATIQLDFQLPERFNLSYASGEVTDTGEVKKQRPVMIHRAVLGSLERMIAILTENYAAKWPFWLSPSQAVVIPIAPSLNDYATQVKTQLKDAGFICDTDLDSGTTLNKKVRNSQLAHYNFIFVVGEKELENQTVNVRTRDNKVHGEHTISHVISRFKELKASKESDAENKF